MKKSLSFIYAMSLFSILSCNPDPGEGISYIYDVQPIFNSNCIDCHSKGGSANLNLTQFSSTTNDSSNNAPIIIAGFPNQSLLIEKIALPNPSIGAAMPINRLRLSDDNILIIDTWIYKGAKDN